jgi:hypothetical protein
MNTKGLTSPWRRNLSCAGLLLAAALAGQPLLAAEPKPAPSAKYAQTAALSRLIIRTAVEQIVDIKPESRRHGLFCNIGHKDHSGDQVITGRTYTLRAGETSNGDVVVIHGHARIEGIVDGDLALVGSDGEITGTVNGDIVSIASKVHFAPGAVVNGDFSSFISAVRDDDNLHVNGSRFHLDVLPAGTAVNLGEYLTGTIFLLRPMSPDSFISWLWALLILGMCLAIGYFFPKPVAETGAILRGRAPASFLCGLAILPAAALLCFLLAITVIGLVAVPLIAAAVFALALVGNAVVFQLIGQRLAPQMSTQKHPVLLWIALGAVVCWVVYCIPVIGFLAGSVVLLAGLGSFSLYLIERSRSGRAPVAQLTAGSGAELEPAKPATAPLPVAPAPEMRVCFWPRVGANAIDLVIIVALLSFLHVHRVILPAWALYRFGMYVWRSATIGEIALGIRVQKSDGSLLTGDYGTALVRALSSLLSLLPLGLGFFWMLFDPAGETWHDKITNTRVVKTRPTPPSPPAPPGPKPESGPGEPPLPTPPPEPGPGHPPPAAPKPVSRPTEQPAPAPKPEFKPVEPPPAPPKAEPGPEERPAGT